MRTVFFYATGVAILIDPLTSLLRKSFNVEHSQIRKFVNHTFAFELYISTFALYA